MKTILGSVLIGAACTLLSTVSAMPSLIGCILMIAGVIFIAQQMVIDGKTQ